MSAATRRRSRPFSGFRSSELDVDLREARIGHGAEKALETLVAAHFDERGHEEEVEALLGLPLLSARRAKLGNVEVASRRLHRRPEAARFARDLAKVAQLLGRECGEPVDEGRVSWIRPDERQGVNRGL